MIESELQIKEYIDSMKELAKSHNFRIPGRFVVISENKTGDSFYGKFINDYCRTYKQAVEFKSFLKEKENLNSVIADDKFNAFE